MARGHEPGHHVEGRSVPDGVGDPAVVPVTDDDTPAHERRNGGETVNYVFHRFDAEFREEFADIDRLAACPWIDPLLHKSYLTVLFAQIRCTVCRPYERMQQHLLFDNVRRPDRPGVPRLRGRFVVRQREVEIKEYR